MSRTNELITNYLDDSLTDSELAELQQWLESDTANLEQFVRAIARDEQLRKVVKSMNFATPDNQPAQPVTQPPVQRSRQAVKWIVAASLILAVSWFVLPNENSASIVTFEGGSAPVALRMNDGQFNGLSAGETFTTGTLQIGGVGTRARFSYADGSKVMAAGGTELKFAGSGQQMILHHGTLAADVTSREKRNPLILRTSTAEAVANGTAFIVDAEDADTLLRVNRGSVKLRRLADNQTLLIAQNQEVRAESVAAQPLRAQSVKALPTSWKAAPKAEGKIRLHGSWTNDGVLKAGGNEIFRKDLNAHETHYQAGVHNDFPGLVTLNEKSAIRIRYRINRPLNVGLFLSTHSPTWNFTGNFQAYIEEHKAPADEDGWRTATIPIGTFRPMRRTATPFQPGCVAATIYATTYADDVNLEVASLEVISIDDNE